MEEEVGVGEKKTRKRQQRKGEKEKTVLHTRMDPSWGVSPQDPAQRVARLEEARAICPSGFPHPLPPIQVHTYLL